ALAFLVLPVAAIFFRVPPGDLVGALGHGVTRDALLVSLKTSGIAHACVLLVGTPAAYVLARRRFRGRALILALVELPLVLPPARSRPAGSARPPRWPSRVGSESSERRSSSPAACRG